MKIKKSKYNIAVEILCLTLLIGVLIYLIFNWNSIPNKIPGHYNGAGEIDRMGNKSELFVIPIISWILYFGITLLQKFPEAWNTGVKVTEENRKRVYRVLFDMISTVKLIMVAVFSYLTINSARAISLSVWFLPVFLVLMFGSIIWFIIRLFRVSK